MDKKKAKEIATEIAVSKDKRKPYQDEDAMMEDIREMADDLYWQDAEREERNRGY